MAPDKINFLKKEYLPLLKKIDPATIPLWGKMNFKQMVEHMSMAVRMANGKDPYTLNTPVKFVDKAKTFMMSDKPFWENTKNALMGEEPAALLKTSINEAFDELQTEINNFFIIFNSNKHKTILNPFFGDLNFNENVHLLHKHASHHLKQFGINV